MYMLHISILAVCIRHTDSYHIIVPTHFVEWTSTRPLRRAVKCVAFACGALYMILRSTENAATNTISSINTMIMHLVCDTPISLDCAATKCSEAHVISQEDSSPQALSSSPGFCSAPLPHLEIHQYINTSIHRYIDTLRHRWKWAKYSSLA